MAIRANLMAYIAERENEVEAHAIISTLRDKLLAHQTEDRAREACEVDCLIEWILKHEQQMEEEDVQEESDKEENKEIAFFKKGITL